MNPAKFAVEIEKLVKQEKINYIDAIVLYCEENSIEIDKIILLKSVPNVSSKLSLGINPPDDIIDREQL